MREEYLVAGEGVVNDLAYEEVYTVSLTLFPVGLPLIALITHHRIERRGKAFTAQLERATPCCAARYQCSFASPDPNVMSYLAACSACGRTLKKECEETHKSKECAVATWDRAGMLAPRTEALPLKLERWLSESGLPPLEVALAVASYSELLEEFLEQELLKSSLAEGVAFDPLWEG